MHSYQRHIGDYSRDTVGMTVPEHGVYTLLLDRYYLDEKPITPETAARLCRGFEVETQSVLKWFFIEAADGWRHRKADEIIAAYHEKAARNRENGKSGGRPKAKKTQTVTNGLPDSTESKGNQKPETRNQEKPPYSPPKGGESAAGDAEPVEKRKRPIALAAWLERLAKGSEKPIPAGDPIFDYCHNAGIPEGFLVLAWREFRQYHLDRPDKRQADWRGTFRNYVRQNYLKLWHPGPGGGYELTAKGVQAQRAREGATNGQA